MVCLLLLIVHDGGWDNLHCSIDVLLCNLVPSESLLHEINMTLCC